jgi:integrase
MWQGRLVRESTKQGNDKVARQMEAARRTSLAKEKDEGAKVAKRLGCDIALLMHCAECDKLFDRTVIITDSLSSKQFCSNHCRDGWTKKHQVFPTLAEFCMNRVEPWARSTFELGSPKTWLWYRFGIEALKKSAVLGRLKLDEIGPEQVAEYASERQRDGLQISSVNSCLRCLRRVLKLAEEWNVLTKTPKVKFLSGEHQRERVISPQEEVLYLNAATPLLRDVSIVLFDTGMRPEECHRMRWEDVSWINSRHGTLRIAFGKTKAARRTLPLTPRVRQILESRWGSYSRPEEGWVWPALTRCGHINSDSMKLQHKKALRLAKLRPFEVYAIRHTFLTRLGESGCDVWTLARIAGHSSITISARYVHPSGDAVLNALSRLGGHKTGHRADSGIPTETSENQLTGIVSVG